MPAMVQEKYANLQSGGEALPSCERVPDSMVLEKRVERPPGAASRRANLNNSSDSLSAARQLYGDGDACPARRRRPRQDALGRSLAFPTKTTKGQRRSRWPATTVVNHLPPVKSAIKNPERCPVPVSGRGQRPRDSECPPRKRRKMQRGSEPNPTVAGSSLSGVQFRPSSLVDGGSATSSATHVVNTDLSDFESVAGSFESNDRSDVPKDDPPQAAPGSLRQSECRAPFDCTDACRSKCRGRHKNRRRRIIQGDARKSDDSHHAISRHMASSNLTRSVSKRKQRSRLRQLPPVEQSRISQVLEVFASLVDGKSRDVFSLVGRDRSKILSQEEVHQALAGEGVVLPNEQLTSVMAFFDTEGRGYVTLGNLHDSLRAHRALDRRPCAAADIANGVRFPPEVITPAAESQSRRLVRPRPCHVLESADTDGVGSALLTPLALLRAPPTAKGSKKRRRSVNGTPTLERRQQRAMGWMAGVSALDITDPEIECLADYLMRPENERRFSRKGDVRPEPTQEGERPDGRCIADGSIAREELNCARNEELWVEVDAGCPISSLKWTERRLEDEAGSVGPDYVGQKEVPEQSSSGTNVLVSVSDELPFVASGQDQSEPPLKSLQTVMAALEEAASRVFPPVANVTSDPSGIPDPDSVRGPCLAAIPSSASRVLRVVRGLSRMWRQADRRCCNRKGVRGGYAYSEEFTDDELCSAARLFDVDSTRQVCLEDVKAMFHGIRTDTFSRQRQFVAAIPTLAALGRHLEVQGLTSSDFVQKAAAAGSTKDNPKRSDEGDSNRHPTNVTKISRRKLVAMGAHRWRAAMTDVDMLLKQDTQLSNKQRLLLLEYLGEDGFVWDTSLGTAFRRARWELEHRRLAKLERQRGEKRAQHDRADVFGVKGISGEERGGSESMADRATILVSASQCRRHRVVATTKPEATAAAILTAMTVSKLKESYRRKDLAADRRGASGCSKIERSDRFNECDACSVVDIFLAPEGSLRNLSADAAAAIWRRVKRRDRGVNAYRAGRVVVRNLQRLLRNQRMKPMQWFAMMESAIANADVDVDVGGIKDEDDRSDNDQGVSKSTVIASIKHIVTIGGQPPAETSSHTKHIGADKDAGNAANVEENTGSATCDRRETSPSDSEGSNSDTLATNKRGKKNTDADGGNRNDNHTVRRDWNRRTLSALMSHLDPCGEGTITPALFQDGLNDCSDSTSFCLDLNQVSAARRFEAALSCADCNDVCEFLRTLVSGGRGGEELVYCVRQIGACARGLRLRETDLANRQGLASHTHSVREQDVRRMDLIRQKLTLPENASAVQTIKKVDKVMAMQGKHLAAEFNHTDAGFAGGVNRKELQAAMEKLVRPCPLLLKEREKRRERQVTAATVADRTKSSNEGFVQKMEALHASKAVHFLEAVSVALRRRMLQIRDVFRDVHAGQGGAINVDDLLRNTHYALGLTMKREEAEALVSILDTDGDQAIQCEELERSLGRRRERRNTLLSTSNRRYHSSLACQNTDVKIHGLRRTALRSYRRYTWERAYWKRRKPFHEEFPSLHCLFHGATTGEGQQVTTSTKAHRRQDGDKSKNHETSSDEFRSDRLYGLKHETADTQVSRADVVAALVRLRGGSRTTMNGGQGNGRGVHHGDGRRLCRAQGKRGRREQILIRAVRKIARCCYEERVRTAPAIAETLSLFDLDPTQESGRNDADRMRRVDLWHWLRLLRLPRGLREKGGHGAVGATTSTKSKMHNYQRYRGGSGYRRDRLVGGVGDISRCDDESRLLGDSSVSRRLLDGEETSIVLDASEYSPFSLSEGDGDDEKRHGEGGRRADLPTGPFVSVSAFWNLLISHVPDLLDETAQADFEGTKVPLQRYGDEAVIRDGLFTVALIIQGAVRQRQARERCREMAYPIRQSIVQRQKASLTVQCAVRQYQARRRVELTRKCVKSSAERENAAVALQCAMRQRQARLHVREKEQLRQALNLEKERAALAVQCAARQRQAKQRLQAQRDNRSIAVQREHAAVVLQCVTRQRQARLRVVKRARDLRDKERAVHYSRSTAATRIQARVRGQRARQIAVIAEAKSATAAAAARAEAEARDEEHLAEAEREAAALHEEREAIHAAIKIQSAARRRQARRKASLQRQKRQEKRELEAKRRENAQRRRTTVLAARENHRAAAMKIQCHVRGWLVRIAAEEEAEKAAIDAAIAASRARMRSDAEATGADGGVAARGRRATDWRKKSVVGARGTQGTAGLTVEERR